MEDSESGDEGFASASSNISGDEPAVSQPRESERGANPIAVRPHRGHLRPPSPSESLASSGFEPTAPPTDRKAIRKPDMEGSVWLQRGGVLHIWVKRYLILRGLVLNSFPDKARFPDHTIPTIGLTVAPVYGRKPAFELSHKDRILHRFRVASLEDLHRWCVELVRKGGCVPIDPTARYALEAAESKPEEDRKGGEQSDWDSSSDEQSRREHESTWEHVGYDVSDTHLQTSSAHESTPPAPIVTGPTPPGAAEVALELAANLHDAEMQLATPPADDVRALLRRRLLEQATLAMDLHELLAAAPGTVSSPMPAAALPLPPMTTMTTALTTTMTAAGQAPARGPDTLDRTHADDDGDDRPAVADLSSILGVRSPAPDETVRFEHERRARLEAVDALVQLRDEMAEREAEADEEKESLRAEIERLRAMQLSDESRTVTNPDGPTQTTTLTTTVIGSADSGPATATTSTGTEMPPLSTATTSTETDGSMVAVAVSPAAPDDVPRRIHAAARALGLVAADGHDAVQLLVNAAHLLEAAAAKYTDAVAYKEEADRELERARRDEAHVRTLLSEQTMRIAALEEAQIAATARISELAQQSVAAAKQSPRLASQSPAVNERLNESGQSSADGDDDLTAARNHEIAALRRALAELTAQSPLPPSSPVESMS